VYATAKQTDGVGQATPGVPMSNDTSLGVGWMRHLLPLHRSARVSGPEPLRLSPNAVQVEDAGQATLVRKMFWPPGGFGVAWTRHRAPFHRSARVVTRPELPTAVQADVDVQATPLSKLSSPVGLNVGTIRHVLPSQRSASVPTARPLNLTNRPPTAMQADDEVQATPASALNFALAGFGVGWMRHLVPFHRSARVRPLAEFPTAVQAERDVQDTPLRNPPPAGFAVAWISHLVPFHRSARVRPFAVPPTAVHAEREVHETLFRAPPPEGLGVVWMRQAWPFHRSAKVTVVRVLLVVAPTAVQAERAVQATPFRPLDAAPGGLGAACVRHVVPFHRSATTAGD
jgi:hypothetical protein